MVVKQKKGHHEFVVLFLNAIYTTYIQSFDNIRLKKQKNTGSWKKMYGKQNRQQQMVFCFHECVSGKNKFLLTILLYLFRRENGNIVVSSRLHPSLCQIKKKKMTSTTSTTTSEFPTTGIIIYTTNGLATQSCFECKKGAKPSFHDGKRPAEFYCWTCLKKNVALANKGKGTSTARVACVKGYWMGDCVDEDGDLYYG